MTTQSGEPESRWRKAITHWMVPAAIVYAILSGVRVPSRWVTTNLILDYHFGFTKRGLFGEWLTFLKSPPYRYAFLAIVAYSIFLASLSLLIYFFCKGRAVNSRATLLFAGFFTSVGFVFLVHDVGYLDHVGLFIALICLLLGSSSVAICIRLVLCALGILVHEGFLLLFLPIVLADSWLVTRPLGASASFLRLLAVAVPCIVLAVYMGRFKMEVPESTQVAYYNSKLSDSKITDDALDPMHLSLSDNMKGMVAYYHEARYLRIFAATVVVATPLIAFYLWIVGATLADAGVAFFARLLFLATAVSPFALNMVAWDEVRFITLIQVTSFLLILSVTRRLGWKVMAHLQFRELAIPAAALIALNVGSEVRLFDAYVMQKFPFTSDFRSFGKTVSGSEPLLSAPLH